MIEPNLIHLVFDAVAITFAILGGWMCYQWRLQKFYDITASRISGSYFLFLTLGSIAGAYCFGTLNLYLTNIAGLGRSVLGALFGAIVAVESYKAMRSLRESTGYIYIVPFCICIILGRVGCLLSGMEDQTAGIETALPWGWDFGDGIPRHPVQLYESLSMALFLLGILLTMRERQNIIVSFGFYFCVGFYALQRFVWEFLKPYAKVVGPLNLFQLLCIVMVIYSVFMIVRAKNGTGTS